MSAVSDRYRIVSELGRGGMGVVYKATDRMLGRTVALKRLLTSQNKMLIDRFLAEAKSIAALNHPNIIQIFDIGKDAEGLYITTEFVDGTDLQKLIKNKGKLAPKIAIKLIVPICEALAYAHARGVIHRDIKPANILLAKDGTPKIADFGLARTQSMKDAEMTGVVMGTKSYASPEQFQDSKHVDHRTDIYSTGAMFHEMVTGKNPQFLRLSDTPAVFESLVAKATDIDRTQRFPSMDAMLAELNAVARVAKPNAKPTVRDDSEMILIPAGPFKFGPQGKAAELPAFSIDKYPVTNAQFARLKSSHVYPPEQANHPATKVTWREANAYAKKLGKALPTEAQWEKAARGTDGRTFPWGEQFEIDRCNCFESEIEGTTPVNTFPGGKSPYGVMDLAGNVWEWTSTYLDARKTARVLKGGAYNGESKFAACHARFAYPEKGLLPTAGFRCAKPA
jgi:serine/threonine protein kinase